MTSDVSSTACWNDARTLQTIATEFLSPEDVVSCESPAYCAIRSHCKEMIPLCYAFDLPPGQIGTITAVLIADEPYRIYSRDNSMDRKTSWFPALNAYIRDSGISPSADGCISSEALLAAISAHWHCTFTETPLPTSSMPNAIRYRLFRPAFSTPSH